MGDVRIPLLPPFPRPTRRAPGERSFTPQFEKLGRKAVEALKAVDGVRQAHRAVKQPAQAAELAQDLPSDLGQVTGIANALLPLAIELAGMIEDKVQSESDKARRAWPIGTGWRPK